MKKKFKYLQVMLEGETTRKRSGKQEKRIAKILNGHCSINSGATLGQNDVITDFSEIEAKTTSKDSFSLKLSDWRLLRKKCASNKIPILVIDFEKSKDSLAVIGYDDLVYLFSQLNDTE